MARPSFDDSLMTGDPLVDAQHRKLYEKVNELQDAIRASRERGCIDDLVDDVVRLAQAHFTDEEALMESHDYPGLDEQRRLHEEFRTDVARMRSEFESDGCGVPLRFAVFLHEWLVRHMRLEDRKIVAYIRSQHEA